MSRPRVAREQEFVRALRRIRGEMNLKPSLRVPVLAQNAGERERALVRAHGRYLTAGAGLSGIAYLDGGEVVPNAATALLGDMKVLIPLEGLVDLAAERQRLRKQIDRQTRDLDRCETKLGNDSFVARAPPAIVDKERTRARELSTALGKLRAQLEALGSGP